MSETTNANLSQCAVPAADGFSLASTLYEPASSNGRAVLINSAMGVKREFYHKYAVLLASQGFAVLTYDYRGIGGSCPANLRGFQAALWEWGAKDQDALLAWLGVRV